MLATRLLAEFIVSDEKNEPSRDIVLKKDPLVSFNSWWPSASVYRYVPPPVAGAPAMILPSLEIELSTMPPTNGVNFGAPCTVLSVMSACVTDPAAATIGVI